MFRRYDVLKWSDNRSRWVRTGFILAKSRWAAYFGARWRHPDHHVRVMP